MISSISLPKPKGKSTDERLLEWLDRTRELLARTFITANPSLDSSTLTIAVTRTIDRLVFIRFLEDKQIEQANHISSWQSWADFISDCRRLDERYSGIIFKKSIIDEQDFAAPEERVFLDICNGINRPNSPYDFNAIPVHILGTIYERFLGKAILATSHGIQIEEKPEVRKAGGVYYTPKYIVDYIVARTIGKIIAGKSPKEIARLRFADIACGGGSFLIGAYDYLLDYHKKYYRKQYKDEQRLLTLEERRSILINNIHGVDIDPQAVEVAQLSLFLKMLEDPTAGHTQQKPGLQFSNLLPDLGDNIIAGNSLTDHSKSFDAIIGNPPYVQQSMYEWFDDSIKKYLLSHYCSSMARLNTFGFFIERAISLLTPDGKLGYIIPNTILSQEYYEELRELILTKTFIEEIVSYETLQFKGAVVETTTLILSKQPRPGETVISFVDKGLAMTHRKIDQETFKNAYKKQFNVVSDTEDIQFKKNIESRCLQLKEIVEINQGIALKSDRGAWLFDVPEGENYKRILDGREINRYSINWQGNYLKYDLTAIHSCKREDIFQTKEKIIFRRVSSTLIATLDTNQFYTLNTLIVVNLKENIPYDLKFILGVFNSKFLNAYYVKFLKSTKKVFSEIQARQVGQLPIPKIDFKDPMQKGLHDRIVQLVQLIVTTKEENKRESLERKIDECVYTLYGSSQPLLG
ncbi:MAG TPA: TaqI-like C-terminal specificity domain-containing protein [Puia sp.]